MPGQSVSVSLTGTRTVFYAEVEFLHHLQPPCLLTD